MKVKVLYFAQIREAKGKSEETLDVAAGRTAGDVLDAIRRGMKWPESPGEKILVAVRRELATRDTPVQDGDEVAFFPLVAGG